MKFSIRAKLLLGASILLILSSLMLAVTYSLNRSYMTSLLEATHEGEVEKGSREIQDYFEDINAVTYGLVSKYREDKILASDSAKMDSFMSVATYIVAKNEQIKKVTFLSTNGKELVKIDNRGMISQEKLSYEVSTDAFKSATEGTTALSKVYYISESLGPHVDIFSPIYDSNATVQGVIKMQINLENLRTRLEDVKVGDNGVLYVVDNEGRLITHHSRQYVIKRPNLMDRQIIRLTLENKIPTAEESIYTNENGERVYAKAKVVPGLDWVVVAEQPASESIGYMNYLRNISFGAIAILIIFLLLISLLLSEYFTRPIRKLQQTAQNIEKGIWTDVHTIQTGDEIEALSVSLSSMVNQLLSREKSIKKENEEMTTILQSLYDAVIGLDANYRIIAFNRAAEKITGYYPGQVVNKHIDDVVQLYHENEKVPFARYNSQIDSQMNKIREKGMKLMNSAGEYLTVSLTTSPIVFEDKKTGYIIAFHDLTKEQQLEEMKIDFVSMAAHELRTPLTAIRGYATLLEMQKAKMLDDAGKQLVQRLLISSDNLSNLIDNLLSVSRIERNIFAVEKRPVKIEMIIQNVIDTIKHQTATKKQNLTMHIQPDLPTVMVDPFRITQVVLNLVSNASNYTKEGGHISIKAVKRDDFVKVSVTDTGQGIPKDALPKLFTKFFRVSGLLEQGSKGTGLGLYICKSIIDMHGGRIWATSDVNKGSVFTFELPIADEQEIKEFEKNISESSQFTKRPGGSIIIRKKE